MAPTEPPPVIGLVTVLSLLGVLAILGTAYFSSFRFLPKASATKIRILFVWHLFDSLIHFIFEGSFLYNCFFSSISTSAASVAEYTKATGRDLLHLYPEGTYFRGLQDRIFGPFYGAGWSAQLWQEYAKADKRWGGSDLTVVSLELLTVLIGGPLSMYIVYLLSRGHGDIAGTTKAASGKRKGPLKLSGKLAFWMTALATGELYGGFMTFAPEWLTGSPNLDTSNFLYMWIYLFFFNAALWVVIPFWILYETYQSVTAAAPAPAIQRTRTTPVKKRR